MRLAVFACLVFVLGCGRDHRIGPQRYVGTIEETHANVVFSRWEYAGLDSTVGWVRNIGTRKAAYVWVKTWPGTCGPADYDPRWGERRVEITEPQAVPVGDSARFVGVAKESCGTLPHVEAHWIDWYKPDG